MYVDTKLKFNIEPSHCDVLIGQVNFATISFRKDQMIFVVKFGDDFADFRFKPAEAAQAIANIFKISEAKAAEIAAIISGDLE